jgi:hypothetical protein
MNAKNTWYWLVIAGALFAFIFFFERHWGKPPPGPPPLLPGFKAAAVTQLVLFSETLPHREIRVVFTNANWWMTQPVNYPAQQSRIAGLLAVLEQLVPATFITPGELQRRAGMEGEFGLENPPTSLVLQQDGVVTTIKFGQRTAPGDQVFAQIVGREGIYVLDAEVLKLLPASADDWRDRALVKFHSSGVHTINITNAGRPVIELQFEPTDQVWRVRKPLPARADGAYLMAMLEALKSSSVSGFVPAEGRPDLETLGLQPPELSVAFAQGNGQTVLLQFGRTNAAGQCYARRDGLDSIVTVPAGILAPWRQEFFRFRDLQLLTVPRGLTAIEVRGAENFTLERTGTDQWRMASEKFPVDAARVQDFLGQIGSLEIVDFVKDVVSTQEFGLYGLTSSVRQVIFKTALPVAVTNGDLTLLEFGSTTNGIIYARRSDEASVYAVRLADFQALPSAGWQLRETRLGNFAPSELARLLARKGGWTRELLRSGTNSWSLGPGSQGVLDNECTEEVALHLGQLRATPWVARGAMAAEDARFGFGTNSLTLAVEMKTGSKLELQFGGYSSSKYPYARVTLDGEPWVFEFPSALHSFLLSCLSVPSGAP